MSTRETFTFLENINKNILLLYNKKQNENLT